MPLSHLSLDTSSNCCSQDNSLVTSHWGALRNQCQYWQVNHAAHATLLCTRYFMRSSWVRWGRRSWWEMLSWHASTSGTQLSQSTPRHWPYNHPAPGRWAGTVQTTDLSMVTAISHITAPRRAVCQLELPACVQTALTAGRAHRWDVGRSLME
jgi:hypothetical protein